jgi:hypothetical protein
MDKYRIPGSHLPNLARLALAVATTGKKNQRDHNLQPFHIIKVKFSDETALQAAGASFRTLEPASAVKQFAPVLHLLPQPDSR